MQALPKVVPLFDPVDSPAKSRHRTRIPIGRLVEISGEGPSARTTAAAAAVLDAQHEGETVAWIQPRHGRLFAPDLEETGVDLRSLVVVHIPGDVGPFGLCRAAELLLRSGGFGLVVIDMCEKTPPANDTAWQGRLLGLARQQQSRLIVLTHKETRETSLGPLVSLRVESTRNRLGDSRFGVEHRVLKNKSGIPLATVEDVRRGPWGLR
jgi:recombination protein RecA